MNKTSFLAAIFAAPVLLAGCTDAPPPQSSGIDAPAGWSRLAEGADAPLAAPDGQAIDQRWWQSFGDPTLDGLVEQAIANNKSLRLAEARVAEVRADRLGARAALAPEISASGSLSRGNQGYATSDKAINIREIDLQASWEIDLFGKNQARLAQASALLQSAEARRQAVLVSLLSEVARTYFDLRNYEDQLAITRENLGTQQKTLELIKAQETGGISSDLDIQRSAAQVATTSAQVPALQAAYDAALNRLNVLLGAPPGSRDGLVKPRWPDRPLPSQVLVAAPASVLANRPDVRAAERQLAASAAGTEAATKQLYPTISLVGLFGFQDSSLFSATPWNLAAGLTQPILNFGRIQSSIDAADARQRQALFSYQQTVLEALEDMENALSAYLNETKRQHQLDLAARQNRRAVELANQQYTAGYSGLLDLLVAQRDELEAESALASSNAQMRKSLVSIYAAAGGGWDLPVPSLASID